ncbi:MAG: GNAT family N-acetyltransferase [Microbacterium sp.]|uniref:GNAT family N-acetyltransferase n=1 Tax=Microbacterium sp. TaxID=51671 RepID=UPI003D6F6BC0
MPALRDYRPEDHDALARICVATADAGADAAGLLDDDDIWSELFLSPYLRRHPDLTIVLQSDDGCPIGYIVGTDDSAGFEEWFGSEWGPRNGARWPLPGAVTDRTQGMIAYGYSRGRTPLDAPEGFPAHLHIDLLPEAQGAGWGRVLIDALCDRLRVRGVEGVHASVSIENRNALGFYPRTGFAPVAEDGRSRTFGRRLRDN